MPSRWSPAPTARRTPRPGWRPAVEALEDRSTPAVTASIANGVLTINLNAPGDVASVTGTDPFDPVAGTGGRTIEVFDGATPVGTPFTDVTSIVVADPGTNSGQVVTFGSDADGDIVLPGGVSSAGVETVNVSTADPLRAVSVSLTAPTLINLNVGVATTAAAGQTYIGPVLLGADLAVDAGPAGLVTFGGTVNAAPAVAADLTVNAGGVTTFQAAVGGTAPLATLTTNAPGTTALTGNVTTTGAQAYADPVTVNATAVQVAATAGGAVTFGGTVNGRDGQPSALTVNTSGATTFAAAVGGVVPLTSLLTDAPGTTAVQADVRTTGSQTYGDPLTVAGAAVTLSTTANGTVFFGSTVNGAVADTTALTVNTGGTTTFGGSVGTTSALLGLATDAAGSTVVGLGSGAVVFRTSGNQTFGDPTRLAANTVTFASTGAAGVLTVAGTLNGTNGITTDAVFDTAGTTALTGVVGGSTPLATLTTDAPGTTTVGAGVTTAGAQTYNDAVTVAPATGVSSVALTTQTGALAFAGTLGGASAVPVTVQSGAGLSFGGNVTFTAAGSRLVARGTSLTFAPNLRVRADRQAYRGGAALDLLTNAPNFRDATDGSAPLQFIFRQDGAITDATLPAVAQFGSAPPADYKIVSDTGAVTIATAVLAGPGTTALTLSAAQNVSLGSAVNAPNGVVRLRSATGSVAQTGGAITAAALGVQAATGIDLAPAGGNAAAAFAARSAGGNVAYASNAAYTVGVVAQDPLVEGSTAVTGVTAAAGTVALTQAGTTALNVTVAAPLAGTTVTATGGPGADAVAVNYTLADATGPALPNGLVFNGGDGNDTLSLTDTGTTTARAYVINNSVVRAAGQPITYTGLESLAVTGGDGADTFNVTPAQQAGGTAGPALSVAGGLPVGAAAGDAVNFTIPAGASPTFTSSTGPDGISGTAAFSAAGGPIQSVTFSQMETVSPQSDIRVTITPGTTTVEPGGTAVFTVVITNLGPTAATGVRVTSLVTAGLLNPTFTAAPGAGATATPTTGPAGTQVAGAGALTTLDIPANGTVTLTVTGTTSTAGGTATLTAAATGSANALDANTANNTASASIGVPTVALTAVGAGAGGGPEVRVFNADGTQRFGFFAYDPSFTGGVTVATGDVTGDGFEDVVTGSATTASHVKVFSGRDGSLVASFFAFPGFGGGVNVAVAGGRVVAGAGVGGGPVLKGFTIAGGSATEVYSVLAYEEGFRGGVQVGGSGQYLTVGAGPGGGPRVRVFREADLAAGRGTDAAQVSTFFAFPVGNADGISVGMGTAGGQPLVIVGAGAGSTPVVATFNGLTGTPAGSFQAFDASFRGGVRVASAVSATGSEATVVGAGPGGAPRVRVLAADRTSLLDLFAFDASFRGGVYVG